jgi:Rab GDP dissociation inhibitor
MSEIKEALEEKFDYVVLGTGLTECVVSGLLSVNGKKVLHLDRNDYYGGESASLNLEQVYKHFEGKDATPPKEMGKSRDWNVDLIPKLIMANGKLIQILRSCGINRLEFMLVEGSYTFQKGKIFKIPANLTEVASSPLMGFFEKNRCRQLLQYVMAFDEKNTSTWQGYDVRKLKMKEFYDKYGVQEETIEFLGHAVACYFDDDYLQQPALPAILRMKLYYESLATYGKSPYIYPLYGLGELPQVFARLCSVYGGTYILETGVEKTFYDEKGHVTGIEVKGRINGLVKCDTIVGDPSYFKQSETEKVVKTGKIIRCTCVMDHPIPDTNNAKACQIIIPQKQISKTRKNDIYIVQISDAHYVCPKGKYIAIIATTVETDKPQDEIKIALGLLGKVEKTFISIVDTYGPKEDGKKDGVFISSSVDSSTHFETTAQDALNLYERITGKKFDVTKSKEDRDKELGIKSEGGL